MEPRSESVDEHIEVAISLFDSKAILKPGVQALAEERVLLLLRFLAINAAIDELLG